jgi:hypothetical protein
MTQKNGAQLHFENVMVNLSGSSRKSLAQAFLDGNILDHVADLEVMVYNDTFFFSTPWMREERPETLAILSGCYKAKLDKKSKISTITFQSRFTIAFGQKDCPFERGEMVKVIFAGDVTGSATVTISELK